VLHGGRPELRDRLQAAEIDAADASFESGVKPVPAPVIASRPELAAVKSLLTAARLPDGDLTDDHLEHFFQASNGSRSLGVVGVELFGDCALLRSLVVRDDSRESGLGSALVKRAEDYARSQGVRGLYLLTTTAQSFFAARGYQAIARDRVPEAIAATREFAAICPATAVLMTKQL
jgi:amino-acid N-acetyltransferase